MRRSLIGLPVVVGLGILIPLSSVPACNGNATTSQTACPAGASCTVSCPTGNVTTITGKVYDPAGKNPLYNVAVYVPATPLTQLPKGVPTGSDACSCGALFKSGAVTSTATAVDGSFTLTNVPVGSDVPLVLQVGKWRRSLTVSVAACQGNAQPDRSLTLPKSVAPGDTDDSMPDIAVSTGSADTLECLLARVGISDSEYVPGTSTSGHVHVFSGGDPTGGAGGTPEETPMAHAPSSPTSLWAKQDQLMPYDVVLLSCEGAETYKANPQALESYLNAGGRAFASHYHYAWFSGPLESDQSYKAPSDWGSNLATWTAGSPGDDDIGGVIDETINGSTESFSKGAAMREWLQESKALGTDGVASTQVAIFDAMYNVEVSAKNKPSQPWITVPKTPTTPVYFSFDTPVNAQAGAEGGAPAYCGRAVFGDMHVDSNPKTNDDTSKPPPASCAKVDLSPQEKVLEFMLFDLSSCVVSDKPQKLGGVL